MDQRPLVNDEEKRSKFLVKETPAETYEALKEARDSLAHALAIIEGLMGGGVG